MGVNQKELYEALLVSAGVVGISYAGQRTVKMGLGVDTSMRGIAKLTVGIVGSTMLIKYLQDMKWLPEDPFKKKD